MTNNYLKTTAKHRRPTYHFFDDRKPELVWLALNDAHAVASKDACISVWRPIDAFSNCNVKTIGETDATDSADAENE